MDHRATDLNRPADALRPRTLRVWVQSLTPLFVGIILLAVFLQFFAAITTVMLGVLAAAIVAITLSPLLRYIPGPRGVAAAGVGLALIASAAALLMALSFPLGMRISKSASDWPKTKHEVNAFLGKLTRNLGMVEEPTAVEKAEGYKQIAEQKHVPDTDLTAKDRQEVDDKLREDKHFTVERLLEQWGNFLTGEGGERLFSRSADVSLSILLWLVFIFVGSIFLMGEPPRHLLSPIISLLPLQRRPQLQRMFDDLGPRLRRWVLGTLLSMTIVFGASAAGYSIVGLQLALPLAILAGLCEIVPTVGPATACVISILFAAATGTGATVAGVLIVYAVIQTIEAYVILPMIMRGAVKMHPAVTLFSVVLWGKIFGVPGLMLAIPINLTLWSIAKYFIIQAPASEEGP